MSADFSTAQAGAFETLVACRLSPDIGGRAYTLSVFDEASGVVLGRRRLPGKPDGSPPAITVADAVSVVGGAYRIGTVRFDLACELVTAGARRLASRTRRRKRAIELRQLRRSAA